MASSLSNLVNNISEGTHKFKCKCSHNDKKCETCRIKYKYCNCFLENTNFQDDLLEYKFLFCNKNYQQKFDGKLREQCTLHIAHLCTFMHIYAHFLTTTVVSLFYCCKKVFILMNI